MNYCKYQTSNKLIKEISNLEILEDEYHKVCFTYIDSSINILNIFNIYVNEINENNELIAHRGYLKEV